LGIPSSLNFAVMGTVILIGVVADQYLTQRGRRTKAARERPETGRPETKMAAPLLDRAKAE
jgi:ribose transport system permease protein